MSGTGSKLRERLAQRRQRTAAVLQAAAAAVGPSTSKRALPRTDKSSASSMAAKRKAADVTSEHTAASSGTEEAVEEETPASNTSRPNVGSEAVGAIPVKKLAPETPTLSVEALLAAPSAKEKETAKVTGEILDLLNRPSAKELALNRQFKSDGSTMREFCTAGTRSDCERIRGFGCRKLHFRKILQRHTDIKLGDCSFLNTCFHMDTCKYIHYEVENMKSASRRPKEGAPSAPGKEEVGKGKDEMGSVLNHPNLISYAPQWIQCDLRFLDLRVLGKCSVVMADPPWDIHMELPYGTMQDDEMRSLNVGCLQDEGLIFLWVTGRAMELGRDCLRIWGYRQCDEIIWVKTNQLQRLIRTGRTGHWLNHGKEHCLVGIKGETSLYHRGLDADVIVGEVRATSHKPDEVYGLIERLSPGTRKVELFGRHHNTQPNWITLGNQLDGVRLLDPELVARFKEKYPSGSCLPSRDDLLEYRARHAPPKGQQRR